MAKDENGVIGPWPQAAEATFNHYTRASYRDRESPLNRVGELFNVNHFVVSQARPYLAPFLRSDLHHPNPRQDWRWRLSMPILRFVVREVQHRLIQFDQLGLLPLSIRRFLLDENVPGPSLTLVPELTAGDFLKLIDNPTKEAIDYWILKGERSVWPAITSLKMRCAIEVELDRGYQLVRRRRPLAPNRSGSNSINGSRERINRGDSRSHHEQETDARGLYARSRARAASFGAA